MVENITMILIVILVVMLMLLGVFCILYLKSKNQKENNNENSGASSTSKSVKQYSVESVFDFMEFDKIEDNMICTKNGLKYVMVVECQGVNYDLMSEVEKNAVEEGFIQFLNTLRHPVQIYTQTRTINLESSLQTYRTKVKELEDNLEKEKRKYQQMVESGRYSKEQLDAAFYELTKETNLCEYGKDIIYTTERMSLNKNVLNQKYYVVIPYYPEELGDTNFDKEEIKNLAFSELFTRAQAIVRTLGVCGVNGKVLNSNELVDLLYVAYNRDESEIYGVNKAIKAGYDELYSTAPDVLDKKMKILDEEVEKHALAMINEKVIQVRSRKQQEIEQKEARFGELIRQRAEMILRQNASYIGKDTTEQAIEMIKEEGKPKKSKTKEEGGDTDVEQETKPKSTRGRKPKSAVQ